MKAKDISLCGLFGALMAICAWISVPVMDVAITMQTFGVLLALLRLGGKRGCAAICVYLALGAVGLPVFSGFRGGLGTLLGTTGGYIWGFLLCGLVFWAITAVFGEKSNIFAAIFGLLVCYFCGTMWFLVAYAGASGASLWAIIVKCVVPYVIPDGLKLWLATLVCRKWRV